MVVELSADNFVYICLHLSKDLWKHQAENKNQDEKANQDGSMP